VPLDAVTGLFREKPANLAGIAVPGMPRGSPGMEMPAGSKTRFKCWDLIVREALACGAPELLPTAKQGKDLCNRDTRLTSK